MAGVRVIDMDRQKAPLIIMGVEQRQLLMTMHGVGGVVDIKRDRLGRTSVTLAPQIHQGVCQPDQSAQVGSILPA